MSLLVKGSFDDFSKLPIYGERIERKSGNDGKESVSKVRERKVP